MSIHTDDRHKQSIGEFCGVLDTQLRRVGMDIEKWKIASNAFVAWLIYQIGTRYEMDPLVIIGLILIVAAPHAAELIIGNGIGPDWLKPNDPDDDEDDEDDE